MNRPTPRFRDGLETLARHGVEFVVVGGVAAVLNGAPISTFDLDIVHARAPANLDRLLAALTELDARYRDLTGRVLRPELSALAGDGHHQGVDEPRLAPGERDRSAAGPRRAGLRS